MKLKRKKIIKKCKKEGLDARKKSPEKQSQILRNLKEWLMSVQEEAVNVWNMTRSYLTSKRDELLEKLPVILRGAPYEIHLERFRMGIFFSVILLLIIFAEYGVVLWTIRPWGSGIEVYLISFVIMSTGMLSIHFFLNKLKEGNPKLYSKIKMLIIVLSLVAIICAGLSLAVVRGELMEVQRAVQENSEDPDIAGGFYRRTMVTVTVSMALVGLCLSLIGGVVLHEALPRLVQSGNVIRTHRKAERYHRGILYAEKQVEGWKQLVRLGMYEFRRGLNS